MKALSTRQPWAWAMFHAGKDVENRDWSPKSPHLAQAHNLIAETDRRILIHASQTTRLDDWEGCECVLRTSGRADLISAMPQWRERHHGRGGIYGGIVGVAEMIGIIEGGNITTFRDARVTVAQSSQWFFGPYGLVLADARALPFVQFKGALGFFNVPDELVREALAA